MADLKTNYVDDVLDTSINTNRKYRMITNSDDTVSFEDVTVYSETGDTYGALEINEQNTKINQINNDLSEFSFRNNEGQAQYSMDSGTTWQDFKHPVGTKSITANGTYDVIDYANANVNVRSAIFIGTYSADTTINVSSYGATSAGQFVLVPSRVSGAVQHNYYGADTISDTYWTLQSMSLSGNNLTIYLPKMRLVCKYGNSGAVVYDNTTAIACKLFFVGTIN